MLVKGLSLNLGVGSVLYCVGKTFLVNPLDAGRRYIGFAPTFVRRQKPVDRVCANFPTAPETGIPGLRKLPNGARNRYTGFIFKRLLVPQFPSHRNTDKTAAEK